MNTSQTRYDRRGTSVRLFLEDGTPDGLRTVTKSNWTGLATMCSRAQYLMVRGNRKDFDLPGVYVLLGDSSNGSERPSIYIGQADNARERLDSHSKLKDFWTQLVLFTSRDEHFNRAHAQYLESRLIKMANLARRFEVENSVEPRLPALSPADRADAEGFLAEMLIIYPLLGINAFEVIEATPPIVTDINTITGGFPTDGARIDRRVEPVVVSSDLVLRANGVEAHGRDSSQGFIVLAGSRLRRELSSSLTDHERRIRVDLTKLGVITETDGVLVFARDYAFSSPSTAAKTVLGRSANGRVEWKTAQGQTLKEIQDAQLSRPVNDDLLQGV